ncbi:MAG: NlpC/P60 family protein [Corynebacterium casei]|uniref:DIP1281 family NlpC/P60 protein n=1 Tax=Corynebacterium sp. TaxID=1720 RepID=UPI002649485E|nr:NlpC/P60 family protein [Corynebacterium sp.]MDN6137678.1 NlpC/P60 family protein [Corynebacterium sp.]MDN6739452.1 NlpC/P60 family protein [Corynebacterium casei]
MATTSSKRTHRMRAALAAVACTLSVSLISTTTPAVAEENASAIEKLQGVLNGDVSVASLAGAIADVQEEIARLEGELGEFRERANQALVDLQDARNLSEQARRGTFAARSELDDAQVDVEGAQEKLDEISRSAYRRANTSESVTSAAGGDAREDMLTRQSFLRSQAEKQQSTVTELERVRTEKSNKESQLRKAEQLAVEREANAEAAEDEARAVLEQNQTRVSEVSSEHEKLVALQQESQAALSSARGEEPSDSESPTEAKGTSSSETPASTSEASEPSAASETSATPATSESESASETAEPADASSSQETPAQSSTQNYSAPVAPSAAGTPGDAPAQAEPGQGSSVDGDQAAQLAGLAVGAASAIIAASQPELSVDSVSGGADTSSTDATSEALVAGSSALFPQQGPAEESSSAAELAGVLEDLPTASSVEESAAAELGDASRSEIVEAVIARAESQIGVPYAWGGGDANGPTKGIRDGGVADSFGDYNKVGFDCSGLMIYAFAGVGISLPHFTGYQYNKGQRISPQEMERGDLIFYGPSGNHHVAIYLGDGMMLEAPQSGQTVTKSPVRWSGMSEYAVRLL